VLVAGAALGTAAIFAATLGHALAAGGLWPPLAALLPFAAPAGPALALGAFVALTLALLAAVFALGAAMLSVRAAVPRTPAA
jgi:hypothetical protein